MRARLTPLLSFVVAASLISGSALAAPNLPTRTSSAAAVMITATPRPLTGTVWEFDVALTTHSGALADDLAKTAALVADGGKSFAPLAWQGGRLSREITGFCAEPQVAARLSDGPA